jgi:hypothetical protein
MRRLPAPVAVGVVAMIVALAACATRGAADDTTGGPATPSPIPITANPSALPVGETIPTGILVGRKELVLYFWGTAANPFLDQAWRDADSGDVEVDNVCAGGRAVGAAGGAVEPGRFFGLTQCHAGDGTLVEYGAVWAEATRITSQDAGVTAEAHYTRWSTNRSVTVFWLQRHGRPVPDNVPDGPGRTAPLPPEHYPLITAYDHDGREIAAERLRPGATEQKGG